MGKFQNFEAQGQLLVAFLAVQKDPDYAFKNMHKYVGIDTSSEGISFQYRHIKKQVQGVQAWVESENPIKTFWENYPYSDSGKNLPDWLFKTPRAKTSRKRKIDAVDDAEAQAPTPESQSSPMTDGVNEVVKANSTLTKANMPVKKARGPGRPKKSVAPLPKQVASHDSVEQAITVGGTEADQDAVTKSDMARRMVDNMNNQLPQTNAETQGDMPFHHGLFANESSAALGTPAVVATGSQQDDGHDGSLQIAEEDAETTLGREIGNYLAQEATPTSADGIAAGLDGLGIAEEDTEMVHEQELEKELAPEATPVSATPTPADGITDNFNGELVYSNHQSIMGEQFMGAEDSSMQFGSLDAFDNQLIMHGQSYPTPDATPLSYADQSIYDTTHFDSNMYGYGFDSSMPGVGDDFPTYPDPNTYGTGHDFSFSFQGVGTGFGDANTSTSFDSFLGFQGYAAGLDDFLNLDQAADQSEPVEQEYTTS